MPLAEPGEGVRATMPLAEQAERGGGAVLKPLPARGEAARSAGEGYSRAGRSVFHRTVRSRGRARDVEKWPSGGSSLEREAELTASIRSVSLLAAAMRGTASGWRRA